MVRKRKISAITAGGFMRLACKRKTVRRSPNDTPMMPPNGDDDNDNDDVSLRSGRQMPGNHIPEDRTQENHPPEDRSSESHIPENHRPGNEIWDNDPTDVTHIPYYDDAFTKLWKKEKIDYSGVSYKRRAHYYVSQLDHQTRRPKFPFFISFKKRTELVETNHYIEGCRGTFFDQAFTHPRCIGEGTYGQVFKAFSKDDKRWYAVKITVEPFSSPDDRENILREVQKHELLPKHPNLVSYKRAWEEDGFLYIQTELCQCNLRDYQMAVGVICEKQLWRFFGDIALAVRYLHSKNLLHRDIKPTNVMISFDGICKLGDFSLIFDITKDKQIFGEFGSPKYMAPEVISEGNSKKSDIYALGLTMIDICTVYELPSRGDLWLSIRRGFIPFEFTEGVPPALLSAILPLLEVDPDKRPSAKEICNTTNIKRGIIESQNKCLKRNIWWIFLTAGYVSLIASSYIVQPARTIRMHGINYVKRKRTRARLSPPHRRFFKATSGESPLFTYLRNVLPKLPLLVFNDDEKDYDYNDNDGSSDNDMETSHSDEEMRNAADSDEEMRNVTESSADEEPHFDEHDDPSSDVLKCDNSGKPSLSGSIIERPKSPEPPKSSDQSPNSVLRTTPPNANPSSSQICFTPIGGPDVNEETVRFFFRWRKAREKCPSLSIEEMMEREALYGVQEEDSYESDMFLTTELRKKAAKRAQMDIAEENSPDTDKEMDIDLD